jgi:hypothetical protein
VQEKGLAFADKRRVESVVVGIKWQGRYRVGDGMFLLDRLAVPKGRIVDGRHREICPSELCEEHVRGLPGYYLRWRAISDVNQKTAASMVLATRR